MRGMAGDNLERLVGILVRFTVTLYNQEILQMAMEQDLVSVLTGLLARTAGGDEVQRLAAVGLGNLSAQSVNLSIPPRIKKSKKSGFLTRCFTPKGREPKVCAVHRGVCSPSISFCLLEAGAAERLVGCLEHERGGVVEAALSAICTLLDERVDVERSVEVLGGMNAVGRVLGVLREHREEEGVRQKSFWLIERFLARGGERSAGDISGDRELPAALVNAFHRGDSSTREVAERVLRHLNRVSQVSRNQQDSDLYPC